MKRENELDEDLGEECFPQRKSKCKVPVEQQ